MPPRWPRVTAALLTVLLSGDPSAADDAESEALSPDLQVLVNPADHPGSPFVLVSGIRLAWTF